MEGLSFEEQVAASAFASLGRCDDSTNKCKRNGDSPDDAAGLGQIHKRGKSPSEEAARKQEQVIITPATDNPVEKPHKHHAETAHELKPYPFFYYKDYSRVEDPDNLQPLTPPGRVPNFPAKMHSILSRSDLADIICWMPHGRAWRVLRPREFETEVLPTYFEHSKFSSFVRQANGWGFRRM